MLLSNLNNAPVARAAAAKAPLPQAPGKDEVFSYNPQDRLVMSTETKVLPNIRQGEFGPTDDHVMLREQLEKQNDRYVYGDDDPRQNSAMAFANAVTTINSFLEVFPEPVKWAFKFDRLLVRPNCGEDFNANYKRESGTVNFYMKDDPVRHTHVHSGASADIVSHEVGHALLDAIRPEYMNNWGPEPGAFHEAFGDMMSIHMALRNDRVVDELVKQTGGDLSKPNLVAQMAEELGTGINNTPGERQTGGGYLRDANNTFKWQDPSKLPDEKGGPGQLGWGKHSFSRVWTGAHFDLLKAMVKERMDGGMDPKQAILQSNDELFKMLANMILEAPHAKFGYRDMAIAFIQSDKMHNDGKRADLIQKVFTARDILPADLPAELLEKDEASRRAQASARLFQSDDRPAFETVQVKLGQDMGQFSGAIVDVPSSLDEGLFKSDSLQTTTQDDLARLIKAGKIRYNDPNYRMKPGDEYTPHGDPYEGVVTWENGQMKIERLHISC
ncbi:hypothetical protein JST97_13965 [bacterium]|nr:hypothetical protein [bacterium]